MKKKPVIMATCCLAGSLLVATPVYAAPTAGVTSVVALADQTESETPVAGVSLTLAKCLSENTVEQSSSVENVTSDENKVSAAAKKTSKYDNLAVAQVDDYINIRSKADADSEAVGKLYSDSVATVIKKVGKWYKIKSGSVTGYVKSEYVVVGDEDLAKSVSTQVATVNTSTLNIRDDASKKAGVVALAADGQKLTVTSMKKANKGWVKVEADGKTGYVSADYVDVEREYTYAVSKEEEAAQLAAEKAAKEAEEAAAKAAQEAEEAAAKAAQEAEEAAAQQETSTQSTASTPATTTAPASTTPATTNNTTTSTTPSTQEAAPAQETTTTQETTTSGQASGQGQEVANYACQFIGNPYVWGGTSLTNGADCSGFVMSVYAHFGVSLPHSSYGMEGCGRAVSTSEMQPGDIICYGSHVAIYIGNNTVVHASSAETGIKLTSPANYRSIVTVRRIF